MKVRKPFIHRRFSIYAPSECRNCTITFYNRSKSRIGRVLGFEQLFSKTIQQIASKIEAVSYHCKPLPLKIQKGGVRPALLS